MAHDPSPCSTAGTAPHPGMPVPVHVAGMAERNGWQPRTFGSSVNGVPLVAWWPTRTPTRVVWAAIHGEENSTLMLAQHLLRVVHADDACAVVVPVLNPDGVLLGIRQNARGVDLNRNFPGTWYEHVSPTYWAATLVRRSEHRTQYSSTGSEPASEPETRALMDLVREVQPELAIDLHAPLECVIATSERAAAQAAHFAEPAGLRIVRELDGPTPGDCATWCEAQGAAAITYEVELGTFPHLWARHRDALVRCIVEQRDVPARLTAS